MIHSLQAYRGIAAIFVILYHASLTTREYLQEDYLADYFPFGAAGVQFFFVLSGFIIYWIHARDLDQPARLPAYLQKRLVRIYPVYWVAVLLVLPLMLMVGSTGFPDWQNLLLSVLLIPQPSEPAPLGVAWTLVHEITFYLAFSVLLFSRRFGGALLAIWAVAICGRILFLPAPGFPLDFYLNPNNLLFLAGILAGVLQKSVKSLQKELGLALFIGGNLLFLAVAVWHVDLVWEFERKWEVERPHVVLAYGLASFLIVVGSAAERVQAFFQPRNLLLFLGDASYSIYLLNYVAVRIPSKACQAIERRQLLPFEIPSELAFLISALFAIVVGSAFYLLVERPLLNLLNRHLFKRTPRKAVPLGDNVEHTASAP